MRDILEKFFHDAREHPDRLLYNFLDCEQQPFAETKVTMREAWDHAAAIAAELLKNGAKKGDRAIILSMQDSGTVYAVWGCMMVGVVFTLIPPPMDESKLHRFVAVLKSCTPRFLISNEGLEKTSENNIAGTLLRKAFFQVATLKRIYTDKVAAYDGSEVLQPRTKEDLIYLQYTSGSTSAPKGVMVNYRNLMACIGLCQELFDFQNTRQVLASWVPFYHNIGLVVAIFMPVFANDAVSIFIPTLQFLQKPSIWLQTLSQYQATVTAAPNSAYDLCTRIFTPEKANQFDLSHITHFINGSEVVDANTIRRFCELFGLEENAFAPGYGLSECVCVASLSSRDYHATRIRVDEYYANRFVPDPEGEKPIVSVGKPAADMQIVAVRENGTPCEIGEIGEIYLRGTNVCGGYWKNPTESQAFEAEIAGYEGKFYRTGDMGVLYDGQLYLTGRIKEMIIISGKNIFPSDIIWQLHEENVPLPSNAVTVFSVQRRSGERPVLCVESDPDADFRGLTNAINKVVSRSFGFSFPDVVFVKKGTLPVTDNRKIKTLAAKAAYETKRLDVLYRSIHHAEELAADTSAASELEQLNITVDKENIPASIRNIFEALLPGREINDHDSFLEMGGDSLRMMELVCELERQLHITVDLREIIADPTIAGISDYLTHLVNGDTDSRKLDLRAECVLDADIAPTKEYDILPQDCKRIFITGTTGFLGAYLIRSLIRQGKGRDITLYCHGRGKSEQDLMARIEQNLRRFSCWSDEIREKLVPVPGDLNQPKLGIADAQYRELAESVDLIIHNGAVLNFVLHYNQMKGTNVIGTAEALRLACDGRPKYFHYISSYSVYDNPSHFERDNDEDDPLTSPDGYFLGYSETKWVAEKLVGIARERGLHCNVYRPGDITGTPKDGIWKLEDLISRSIVGCIQLKAMPTVEVNMHLTPVDFVADAIACIAFQEQSINHAFNILNENLMPFEQFHALLNKLGYEMKCLPYAEWCKALEACSAEENVLRVLSCLFTDQRNNGEGFVERYGVRQAKMSTANTAAALKGNGIVCPPVDAALMTRYLQHFADCGYIPKPAGKLSGLMRMFSGKDKNH